jgi:hypothetical protein
MNGWMDRWMNGWLDEWLGGWMNGGFVSILEKIPV